MTDLGGPKRNEPQRHRGTEKRKAEKKRALLRKPGIQEKKEIILHSWFPGFLSGISSFSVSLCLCGSFLQDLL
jgi:hypothetical protein